ncbi:MAG: DeoR/GlpR family DNA-binding transcription regulator [Clostridiales bacterium]
MFGVQRRTKILSILNKNKSILVNEVATMFEVTEETIRRDLKFLEKQGDLIRTHGGAVLPDDIKEEISIKIREGINSDGKNLIAKNAAKLVNDGDIIILDASTSALYMTKYLKDKTGLTVITNAARIAIELADCNNIKVISTGGILRAKSLSFVGRVAENALKGYYANKMFFSCKGFSPKKGLTDSSEEEAGIRKLMIERSEKVIFLCDHTKFDKMGYVNTTDISKINKIISDTDIPKAWNDDVSEWDLEILITKG